MNTYYKETLQPNGLRVITSEHKDLEIVTISLWVKAGSRYETEQERGYAHILEHMLFNGSKNFPSPSHINIVVDRAGGYHNAFTGAERIYFINQASKYNFEKMVELLADMIQHPLLDSKVLDNEQQVIVQELRRLFDNPARRVWINFYKEAFKGHPLSQYPLGTEESILSSTAEKLKAYHQKYFIPNRAALIVQGGVTHDQALNLAEKYFGGWVKQENFTENLREQQIKAGFFFDQFWTQQTHLTFGFIGKAVNLVQSTILDLISTHLNYGASSVLWRELREKKGLVYEKGVYNRSVRDMGIFSIYTATTKPDEVSKIILKIIDSLDQSLNKSNFEETKNQQINIFLRKINDPFTEIEFIGEDWVMFDKVISPKETIETIKKLTYQDFLDVKNHYFKRDNLFIVAVGQEDPKIAEILEK